MLCRAHLQVDVACVATKASICLVCADVQALAQAHIVDLLPVRARPDQQPLLAHGHKVPAVRRQLHLQDGNGKLYSQSSFLCFLSSDSTILTASHLQ